MEKILIHPTYFPSIVQMVAVAKAKEVVFETEDNYQKQSYRNRAYIAHSNGILLLNVPVKHSKEKQHQKYKEVRTEDNFPWQQLHWKSLQSAYRTSPFFEYYEDDLEPFFLQPAPELMAHNLAIFNLICDLTGLTPTLSFTKEFIKNPEEVTDLRGLANAKNKKEYALETYTQVLEANHGFLPNLSILDLLFNEGPNTITYLENQQIFF